MASNISIDDIDRRIIGELQADAGATNTAIAARVGVSDVTVAGRIRRLVELRVIKPTLFYDPAARGYTLYALCQISADGRAARDVANDIATMEEIHTVVTMLGDPDIVVLFFTHSVEEAEAMRSRIAAVPGVRTIDLALSLKLFKFHNSYGVYGMLMDRE